MGGAKNQSFNSLALRFAQVGQNLIINTLKTLIRRTSASSVNVANSITKNESL